MPALSIHTSNRLDTERRSIAASFTSTSFNSGSNEALKEALFLGIAIARDISPILSLSNALGLL